MTTLDLLTTAEAAALAGCSEAMIRRNLKPIRTQTHRVSRNVVVTRHLYAHADVAEFASLDAASRRRAAASRRKEATLIQHAAELANYKAKYDESLHQKHGLHVGDRVTIVHKGRLGSGYLLGPLGLDEDPVDWTGVTLRHGNSKRPRIFADEGCTWTRRSSLSPEERRALLAAYKLAASNPE